MASHVLPALGVAVLALLVAGFGAYRARDALAERSAVQSAPDASAGALRAGQGPVELRGNAHAAEHSFVSPLTQQECVAYRFVKEEKQKKQVPDHTDDNNEYKTKYEWETIHEEESGAPFYVDDGTGRTLVDGSTADLDMERSYEVDTDDVKDGIGEKVVATVSGLVGGEGGDDEEGHEIPQQYVEELENARYGRRFKEWVVHEGEEVYVYGEAVRPEQTPLGSGVDSELSSAASGMQGGGILGVLKGLVGLGAEAATNPRTRYKPRAVSRLSDVGTGDVESPVDEQRAQEMAEQAEQLQGQNARQNPEAAREMMDQVDQMVGQASTAAQDALPDTPAMDDAPVVVSWGQQAPTFVVSDQGKESVLRNYSTGVAKYALLAVVGGAVAVGAVAYAVGLV